jgi:uncharacterized Zn finger protein (UPF0148 family)
MSDFDREAERERLEEQYERDQEKRAATERMSDLLLKGATMTDAHCEHCGDPIFRYEGEEFCPTCQQLVEGGEGTTDETGERPAETGQAPDQGADSGEAGSDDGGVAVGGDSSGDSEGASAATTGETTTPRDAQSGSPATIRTKRPTGPTADDTDAASGGSSADGEPASNQHQPDAGPRDRGGPDDGLADARASLARALQVHAQQAAETDDPHRAQDHLAAAREAAEALAAFD